TALVEGVAADEGAVAAVVACCREEKLTAPGARAEVPRDGVVGVEDDAAGLILEGKDVALELDVFVPGELVEVIGCDVEKGGDVGAAVDEGELGVADLEDGPSLRVWTFRVAIEEVEEADADVAAEDVVASGGGEGGVDERGRRRLARAARNA